MTVYVLIELIPYEVAELWGVFSTKRKAKQAKKEILEKENIEEDDFEIYKCQVDEIFR